MAKKNEAKVVFRAEVDKFDDAIKDASSTMSVLQSELKLLDAEMENSGRTAESLEKRESILEKQQEQLAAKTQALVGKQEAAERVYGKNSIEARKLAAQVNRARTAEERMKTSLSKCNSELDEAKRDMNRAASFAKKMAQAFEDAKQEAKELGNSVGDIAAGNMLANAGTSAISAATGLEESTRQYRNEQNKLVAIAETNGQSLDVLKGSYSDLYAITADETLASTAVANMSAMGLSQENTNKLLTAATGIWAQYGDSIPLDGLMESINETASCGTVTGNLADALNWAGISEEEFNEGLAACSNEQERQQYIVDALNGEYGGLAESYRENNAAVIESNKANEKMMDAQSKLAEQVAPLQAAVTSLAAGGIAFLAENLDVIAPIAIGAGVAFGILAVAMNFGTIVAGLSKAMALLNGVMALNPAVLIVAGIALLIGVFVALWNRCEGFRNFWIGLWENIKSAAGAAWEFVTSAVEDAKVILSAAFNAIRSVATAVFNGIKSAITNPIQTAMNVVKGIVDRIKGFFNFQVSLPKIKLPHFHITPEGWQFGDLLKGEIPSLSIKWYADGGIMTRPTVFGMSGTTLHAGGEAGAEAILPISKLQDFIDVAFQRNAAAGASVTNVYIDGNLLDVGSIARDATDEYLDTMARLAGMNR